MYEYLADVHALLRPDALSPNSYSGYPATEYAAHGRYALLASSLERDGRRYASRSDREHAHHPWSPNAASRTSPAGAPPPLPARLHFSASCGILVCYMWMFWGQRT